MSNWEKAFIKQFEDDISGNDVMLFIKELRKRDCEELQKILSNEEHTLKEPVNNKDGEIQWHSDLHYNCGINCSKKVVKDYFNR